MPTNKVNNNTKLKSGGGGRQAGAAGSPAAGADGAAGVTGKYIKIKL